VLRVLSQLSKYKIEALKKKGIDPENWAAGWILSMLTPYNLQSSEELRTP